MVIRKPESPSGTYATASHWLPNLLTWPHTASAEEAVFASVSTWQKIRHTLN